MIAQLRLIASRSAVRTPEEQELFAGKQVTSCRMQSKKVGAICRSNICSEPFIFSTSFYAAKVENRATGEESSKNGRNRVPNPAVRQRHCTGDDAAGGAIPNHEVLGSKHELSHQSRYILRRIPFVFVWISGLSTPRSLALLDRFANLASTEVDDLDQSPSLVLFSRWLFVHVPAWLDDGEQPCGLLPHYIAL